MLHHRDRAPTKTACLCAFAHTATRHTGAAHGEVKLQLPIPGVEALQQRGCVLCRAEGSKHVTPNDSAGAAPMRHRCVTRCGAMRAAQCHPPTPAGTIRVRNRRLLRPTTHARSSDHVSRSDPSMPIDLTDQPPVPSFWTRPSRAALHPAEPTNQVPAPSRWAPGLPWCECRK